MKHRRSFVTLAIAAIFGAAACSGPCDDMCDKLEECFKGEFDSDFSDNSDCVKECEDELEKIDADACKDAVDEAGSCYSDMECKDLAEHDYDSCESQFEDVEDKCEDEEDFEGFGVAQGGGGGNNNDDNNNDNQTAACAFTNDGECDEPEGTGACAEGTDTADCS